MSESQTFSESWYRVADKRIYLRPGINVRRQNFRGERWMVLENPFRNQFFRLRPVAWDFVGRLGPNKTVQEAWQECLDRFPDEAPGQEQVIQLLAQLYFANLLQYEEAFDSAKLFERYEKNAQRELRARLTHIMFMRFPLLDPDDFLKRTLPFVRWLITPIGALLWLVVVGWGLKVAVDNFDALWEQSQAVLSPNNLILLYLGMIVIKVLHEFGHAYVCRRYGGEVHVMGILLMVFTPMPYVDASSSWGFRHRWQRVLVGFSGMLVEVFVAALAVFIWAQTGTGLVHNLAYNMIFVASVSTIIFNINPLLRYDGYYILSDLVGIPNLSQRSMEHLKYLAERYLFGVKKAVSTAQNRRERAWFVGYGITSTIYRIIVFAGILLFVADRFLILGIIMAAVCFIAWVTVPIIKLINYLVTSPKLDRTRARAVAATLGIVGGLLAVLEFVPLPYHFRAPGILEAQQWTQVLNDTEGRIQKVVAATGTWVRQGDALIELESSELDLRIEGAQANILEVETRIRAAMQEETANLRPLRSKLGSLQKELASLQDRKESLIIRARQDGLFISPEAYQYTGRYVVRGTPLGLVLDTNAFEFTVTVLQADVDRLFSRQFPRAEVRLLGQAGLMFPVTELKIIPVEQDRLPSAALGWAGGGGIPTAPDDPHGRKAAEPFFSVRGLVEMDSEAALLHGRTGRIRFDLPPEPLLPRWYRAFRQLLQKRYQI